MLKPTLLFGTALLELPLAINMGLSTVIYKGKTVFNLSKETKNELLSDFFSVGSSYNWTLSTNQKKRFLELFPISEMSNKEIEILRETIFLFYYFEAYDTLPAPNNYSVSEDVYEAMSYEDRDWLDERDQKVADFHHRYRLLNDLISDVSIKRKKS